MHLALASFQTNNADRGLRRFAREAAATTAANEACSFPMGAKALSGSDAQSGAEIIGAPRLWTVSMISAVSMPSR